MASSEARKLARELERVERQALAAERALLGLALPPGADEAYHALTTLEAREAVLRRELTLERIRGVLPKRLARWVVLD